MKWSLLFLFFPLLLITSHANCQTTAKDTASGYIELNSGQVIPGKVQLKEPFLASSYLLLNDSSRYALSNVRFFRTQDGYFGVLAPGGGFVDRRSSYTVVKRVSTGKLDVYQRTDFQMRWMAGSTFSTPGGVVSTPGMMSSSTNTFEYFSKNHSPILEADFDNLSIAMADNTESIQCLDQYQTLGYWKWGLIGGGLAVTLGGFATSDKDHFNVAPVAIGVFAMVSSWIPKLMQDDKFDQALDAYNR